MASQAKLKRKKINKPYPLLHSLLTCSQDCLSDMCCWLDDDDGDISASCHSYQIQMITGTLNCALYNGSMAARRNRLRNFLHYPKFLQGKEVQWQVAQFAVLTEIAEYMRKKDIESYNFPSKEAFKEFLISVDMITVLKQLMTIAPQPSGSEFQSWPCVAYQCLSIVGNLVAPEDLEALITPHHKQRKLIEKIAWKIVATGGVVESMVGFLRGSAGVCEMVRAAWALRNIVSLSDAAIDVVIKEGGIPVLVELFRPGHFQKKAAAHRDEGFAEYEKTTLSEGFDTMFDCCDPEEMSDDECYHRIMKRVCGLQENTGAILSMVASVSASHCFQVFETRSCVSGMLKWLRHPLLLNDHHQSVATSAAQLLIHFLKHRVIALYLVEELDLLTVLERNLYMPESWPLDDLIACCKVLLDHGSPFLCKLASRERILVATGIYCHSACKVIQDVALSFIVKLCKSRTSVIFLLHNKGIINQFTMAQYDFPLWDPPVPQLSKQLVTIFKKAVSKNWQKPQLSSLLPHNVSDMEPGFFKEKGNNHFKQGEYEQAIRTYSGGIYISHGNDESILLSNRAECYLRLHRYEEVVRDCTHSISLGFHESSVYAKSLFRRAKAFQSLQRPFEALGDLAACLRENPGVKQVTQLYDEVLVSYRKLDGAVYRVQKCGGCGMDNEGMKKCANCNKVYFCSRTCLKRAWPDHKKVCSQPVAAAKTRS